MTRITAAIAALCPACARSSHCQGVGTSFSRRGSEGLVSCSRLPGKCRMSRGLSAWLPRSLQTRASLPGECGRGSGGTNPKRRWRSPSSRLPPMPSAAPVRPPWMPCGEPGTCLPAGRGLRPLSCPFSVAPAGQRSGHLANILRKSPGSLKSLQVCPAPILLGS